MPKEKFLGMFGLSWFFKKVDDSQPLSIINYYQDKDQDFVSAMMKHFWFEKNAPNLIKKFWAHHRYFIFVPQNNEK
jgi:hypothetical protein